MKYPDPKALKFFAKYSDVFDKEKIERVEKRMKDMKSHNKKNIDEMENEEKDDENDGEKKSGDGEDEKELLLDEFVAEMAVALAPFGSRNLSPNKLKKNLKRQSVNGMYGSDSEDEFKNYKHRFKNAGQIAKSICTLVKRGEQHHEQPEFTEYPNVSDEMEPKSRRKEERIKELSLDEDAKSKAQRRLMGMAYAYKEYKRNNNTHAIDDLFGGVDQETEKEIKNIADSMSMDDLEDYAETEEDDLPDKVDEDSEPENQSERKNNLMKMAYKYKKMKENNDTHGISKMMKNMSETKKQDVRNLADSMEKKELAEKAGISEKVEKYLQNIIDEEVNKIFNE